MTQKTQLTVHVDPELAYFCHNSGVCCSLFPRILVDTATLKRLEGISVEELQKAGADIACFEEALTYPDGFDCDPVLRRRSDGKCLFLTSENLCALHQIGGPEAKPQVCRDFPFLFRQTPAGVFVGMSFVCPSIRKNAGTPLVQQVKSLSSRVENGMSVHRLAEPFVLNDHFLMSWCSYAALEEHLTDLLRNAAYPLSVRLIASNVTLNLLDLYLQARIGRPEMGKRALADHEMIRQYIDEASRSTFTKLWAIASKKLPTRRAGRVVMGLGFGLTNLLWQRQDKAAALSTIVHTYAKALSGLGSLHVWPLPRKVPVAVLSRTKLPLEGPALALIERYVRHRLFRKDLLVETSIARALNLIILHMGYLRWYAAAEAFHAGRTEPNEDDWSSALQHVEAYCARHSQLFRIVTRNLTVETIIEGFMARRNYPFIVMQ